MSHILIARLRQVVSIHFSRSLSALQAERDLHAAGWLALTLLLLAAWLAWLLLARLAIYETAATARLVGAAEVEALFAPAAGERLRPGQPAWVGLDVGPGSTSPSLPAVVACVAGGTTPGEPIPVRLILVPAPAVPHRPGLAATAVVEVARLSPATLFLRAAGAGN